MRKKTLFNNFFSSLSVSDATTFLFLHTVSDLFIR